MGNIISSWNGTGENSPISPAQIERALGSERKGELAGGGTSPEAGKAVVACSAPADRFAEAQRGQR